MDFAKSSCEIASGAQRKHNAQGSFSDMCVLLWSALLFQAPSKSVVACATETCSARYFLVFKCVWSGDKYWRDNWDMFLMIPNHLSFHLTKQELTSGTTDWMMSLSHYRDFRNPETFF